MIRRNHDIVLLSSKIINHVNMFSRDGDDAYTFEVSVYNPRGMKMVQSGSDSVHLHIFKSHK